MPVDREALREELHDIKSMFEVLVSQLDIFISNETDEGLKQSFEIARMKLGGSLEWMNRSIIENEKLVPIGTGYNQASVDVLPSETSATASSPYNPTPTV
jgi:hypothetical protein